MYLLHFNRIGARNLACQYNNPVGGIGSGQNTLEAGRRCCRREGKNLAKNWRARRRKNIIEELDNRKQGVRIAYDSCPWYRRQPGTTVPPTILTPPDQHLGKKTKNNGRGEKSKWQKHNTCQTICH
jgi:hypothetical protein